jgi:hypothetical protein
LYAVKRISALVNPAHLLGADMSFDDELRLRRDDVRDGLACRHHRACSCDLQVHDIAGRRRDDHLPRRGVGELAQLLLDFGEAHGGELELVACLLAVVALERLRAQIDINEALLGSRGFRALFLELYAVVRQSGLELSDARGRNESVLAQLAIGG